MVSKQILNHIFSICLLSFCLSSVAGEFEIKSEKIYFKGELIRGDFLKLKELLEANKNIKEIVLLSPGGEGIEAMAMGGLIKRYNLNVNILGLCVSSCANYLFIAGAKKRLSRDALVIFHGGIQQKGLKEQIDLAPNSFGKHGGTFYDDGKGPALPDYLLNELGLKKFDTLVEAYPSLVKLEKQYFIQMKVKNDLPTYGQEGKYSEIWNSKKYPGFFYDIESLNRLGVTNIEVEGGEWRPEENPIYSFVYRVRYP
jgi:hypothetical protein